MKQNFMLAIFFPSILYKAEILRPLRRVFDRTAEPVRKLLVKSSPLRVDTGNILNNLNKETYSTNDILPLVEDDGSKFLTPSVSNRKSLTVLNDRMGFERQLVGIKDNLTNEKEPKKSNILVITATIVKENERTLIQPSSVSASMGEEFGAINELKNFSIKQEQNPSNSIVEHLL